MPYASRLVLDPEPYTIGGRVQAIHDRLPGMASQFGDPRHGSIAYRYDMIARRNIGNTEPASQAITPVGIPRLRVASCNQQGKQ